MLKFSILKPKNKTIFMLNIVKKYLNVLEVISSLTRAKRIGEAILS